MMILQMDQTLHIRPLSVEFDHTLRLKGDRRGGTVTFELFGRDQEGVEHRLVLLPQKVEASQEDPQSASADERLWSESPRSVCRDTSSSSAKTSTRRIDGLSRCC